jgi:hypothetical protein
MPITIAHPIAAVPLRRPLGRLGVLSALVIGSIMPDLPLFLPISLNRNYTHSLAGLFWFCLPVGVLAYLLYDRLLERPFLALLPDAWQRRLVLAIDAARPPVWSAGVLVSLLAGAATHSGWDAFTHGESAGVRWLPVLETRLFTLSGYTAYLFSVLQHTSSLLGTITLLAWIRSWYRRAPQAATAPSEQVSASARRRVITAIAVVVVIAVVVAVASRLPARPTLRALQAFVRRVIVAGISSLAGALAVYAAIWHWVRARGQARPV